MAKSPCYLKLTCLVIGKTIFMDTKLVIIWIPDLLNFLGFLFYFMQDFALGVGSVKEMLLQGTWYV